MRNWRCNPWDLAAYWFLATVSSVILVALVKGYFVEFTMWIRCLEIAVFSLTGLLGAVRVWAWFRADLKGR